MKNPPPLVRPQSRTERSDDGGRLSISLTLLKKKKNVDDGEKDEYKGIKLDTEYFYVFIVDSIEIQFEQRGRSIDVI